MSLSPAHISARPSGDGHCAEGYMPNTRRKFFLNEQNVVIAREAAAWAKCDVPKVLSRELPEYGAKISESRVYKLRAGTDGVSASTWEAIKAHRLARALRQRAEAEAVIRQSLGELAELYPDAVEQVLRGGK